MEEVEVNQIDASFERVRIRDKALQKALLDSILEGGIREPLKCAIPPERRMILLDGFKRLRCAVKLGIKAVPVVSLGIDEPTAILQLLRISTSKMLSTLEQAALVDELHQAHTMSVSQIAHHLERSPAWVSLRLGLIADMSEAVQEAIFEGRFPVRSYMYTLRHFTERRAKGVSHNGWNPRLVRSSQPPVASLECIRAIICTKRRQQANRPKAKWLKGLSHEMTQNEGADTVVKVESNTYAVEKAR